MMISIFKYIFSALILISFYAFSANESKSSLTLKSPNNNLIVYLQMNENGEIYYSLKNSNLVILKNSALGYKLKSIPDFNRGWRIKKSTSKSFSDNWTAVWGPDKMIVNSCNELKVSLEKEGKYELYIYIRAFNDGIAIRYEIPQQFGISNIEVTDELTEFSFASDAISWSIPQNFNTDELEYRKLPISKVQNANTPITIQDENYFASIHEAALTDYAQMTLAKGKDPLTFKADLVPWPDGIKVKAKDHMISPWRTIQITNSAGKLISSHLIENLNEPNKIADVSWIKPGKYVGVWWEMHLGASKWYPTANDVHGANTENTKRFIDFASKNNIQAVLTEGWNKGWETRTDFSYTESYPDFDLPYLAKYAHDKGVDLVVHNETASDIPNYESQLEKAFSYYQSLGIHYVKTGYVNKMVPEGMLRHGQYMVNHYRKVIECAAKHEIMLDVHEPIMDTGERRTFPNMMTREGIKGMEFEAWSEGNTPTHTATIPFTRMLAGPLDYNPGIFDILFKNADPEKFRTIKLEHPAGIVRVHSTLLHQLALFNILYSPLQMAPDLIKNYEGHPAFKFIKDSKTTWDETRILDAKIGEYLVVARRSGEEWFVCAITNEQKRILNIDLSFLDNKKYNAEIYADGTDADWIKNPMSYEIYQKEILKNDKVILKLAAGGGQAIRLYPKY